MATLPRVETEVCEESGCVFVCVLCWRNPPRAAEPPVVTEEPGRPMGAHSVCLQAPRRLTKSNPG